MAVMCNEVAVILTPQADTVQHYIRLVHGVAHGVHRTALHHVNVEPHIVPTVLQCACDALDDWLVVP